MKKMKTLQTHVVTCPASKFVLTVLLPSGAEKFPVSEAGDCRASSTDNELVTKSEILTNSNRHRWEFRGARCSRTQKELRAGGFWSFERPPTGSPSGQVFRTSAPTKGQGNHGNGKKVMQHTEQSATDRGRGPASLARIIRCVSPLPARPRHPTTSAGSGRSGRRPGLSGPRPEGFGTYHRLSILPPLFGNFFQREGTEGVSSGRGRGGNTSTHYRIYAYIHQRIYTTATRCRRSQPAAWNERKKCF